MAFLGVGPVDSHQCWCWTSHECLRTFKSNERSRSNLDRLGRLGNLSQNMIRSFPYSFIPCRKEIFTMTHHVTFIKLKRLFPKKTGHDPCVCVCVFFLDFFFRPAASTEVLESRELSCVGKMKFLPASWGNSYEN